MHVEFVILGQGLAGSALAWQLQSAGSDVLLIDAANPTSASRIAAGLITPFTGKRFIKSWLLDEAFPIAQAFYHTVELATRRVFFRSCQFLRLFRDDLEAARIASRVLPNNSTWILPGPPLLPTSQLEANSGGIEMRSARLDVCTYLEATREWFDARGNYLQAVLDLPNDVTLTPAGVSIPRFDVTAQRLICCQGWQQSRHPWFHELGFNPAKGEILTLEIPGFEEDRVIQRGIWLAPEGHSIYRLGATYEWDRLDDQPTNQGRAELLRGLGEVLKLRFQVLAHQAAIRPATRDLRPLLGIHPEYPQLAIFNGLGSKGALLAPYFASQLKDHLLHGRGIDPMVDIQRWRSR